MMPSEAIHGFLEAFDVPTERIPVTLHGQAAMYRTLLAGKRVLVVLDNARDTDQVRPLLPGSAGCFVVATSRNRLTSLLTTEGAYPVTLDLLSVAEATELLEQRIGRHRVTAEPEAAAEIISMCARLPLALAIVAARAATHPTFSLAALASELRQVDGTLAGLAGGEVSTDLRAVFSWSYERLGDRAGRLFCLMGLHPGPDLSLPAAVSLAGSSGSHTRAALTELAFAHMIDEVVPGRFTFHDLLRAYAGEQARTSVADGDRSAAMQRLLSHYLYSGNAAALRQIPRTAPLVLPELPAGVSPESPADFDAAQAWFDAEHAIMLGAVRLAAHSGFNVHAWQLAWILIDYLDRRGSWQEWMMAQQIALEVVKANDDRLGEAFTHRGLGLACLRLGHYVEAEEHFHQSRRIFGELGDVIGYADSNIDLGWMLGQQGRPKEALDLAVDVLETSMSTDHKLLQARAANNIGWFYALAGEPVQTLSFCEQALELYREIGDPRSEAYALVFLGYAHLCLGHHAQAVTYLERSLTLERAASDRYRHAMALSHLGAALRASGRVSEARNSWTEALQLLSRLGVAPGAAVGYPDPGRIRADLDAVDSMKDEPIPLADESPSRG
jgi:tetratricopeptide (TPR) repeat protein